MMQFSSDGEVQVAINIVNRRIFFDVIERHVKDSERISSWFYQEEIHDKFLETFAPHADRTLGIYEFLVGSGCVKFYYVLECGQHVSDSIDMCEFVNFCERIWNDSQKTK